jgi:3-hydroxyisobutyrate dehydrogenase-like beta-hydroxyacid dehydrogenase
VRRRRPVLLPFPRRGILAQIRVLNLAGTAPTAFTLAERLLGAGVGVQAWNRTPGKLAGLVARGAAPLAAPALSEAAVPFSMVLNDEALDRL